MAFGTEIRPSTKQTRNRQYEVVMILNLKDNRPEAETEVCATFPLDLEKWLLETVERRLLWDNGVRN